MTRLGFWALGALLAAACGKKGPPLAPLVPIPAAVEAIEADRVGSDVFVSLTLPTANVDEFIPANLGRVEIYGYTGRTAPPRGRWVEFGALVAAVPVAPPPPQEGEEPRASGAAPVPPDAPSQGARVTIRDTLTPDELVQGKVPAVEHGTRGAERAIEEPAAPKPERELPLRRFYTALPFNVRGTPGPPGGVAEFPLLPVPDPPPAVDLTYDARTIVVAWEPSGGLLGFLLDRTIPEEPAPLLDEALLDADTSTVPAGPVQYNVYREMPPDPLEPPRGLPQAPWRESPPPPLNAIPTAELEITDGVDFGRMRCYSVRAVRGAGTGAQVGPSSPRACVTPVDTFAPAAPRSLTTVASEGAVSLIWEPNTDFDLGGYVVLRGDAGSDTLHPLTSAPVLDARYRDDTVTPGARYVYAVVAVDNRFPIPNVSTESNRVEETAR